MPDPRPGPEPNDPPRAAGAVLHRNGDRSAHIDSRLLGSFRSHLSRCRPDPHSPRGGRMPSLFNSLASPKMRKRTANVSRSNEDRPPSIGDKMAGPDRQTDNDDLHPRSSRGVLRGQAPTSSISHRQYQNGFALVALIAFLPLVLTGVVLMAATSDLISSLEKDRRICRQFLAEGLERAGRRMRSLVNLNSEVMLLRLQEQSARTGMKLAMSRMDAVTASAYRAWLARIKSQQLALDRRQKTLLQQARTSLSLAQHRAVAALKTAKSPLIQRTNVTSGPIRVALVPDRPGLAPRWFLHADFSTAQQMKISWKHTHRLHDRRANLLKGAGQREDSCTVTLVAKGPRWRARLAEDRSLLKPSGSRSFW